MTNNLAFAHTHVFSNSRCQMILLILMASMLPWFFFSGCSLMGGSMGDGTMVSGMEKDSLTQNTGKVLSDAYKNSDTPSYHLSKKVLATAYTQVGKPYRFGGSSPDTGFDCSGFVQWTFAQNGVKLPRDTKSLLGAGREVGFNDLRPGDLVIFKQANSRTGRHAGIYVGEGMFIHSPSTGDRVKETPLTDGNYSNRFIGARRVINDPLAAPLPDEIKDQIVNQAVASNNNKTPDKPTIQAQPAEKQVKTAVLVEPVKTAAKPVSVAVAAPKPTLTTQIAPTAKTAPAKTPVKTPAKKYAIQKGDTIWTIAKKFGSSETEIRSANKLSEKQLLQIGQVITIPTAN